MDTEAGLLALIREMATRLPEVWETTTFGHPTFKAGKKSFAVIESHIGEPSVCFRVDVDFQAELVEDPRFFVAPYIGRHGWTCMRIGSGFDWPEVEALLEQSYRGVALKRMLAALDD